VELEWPTKPLGLSQLRHVVKCDFNVVYVLIYMLLEEPFDELLIL
jgi:hypothetical protein